MEYEGLPMSDLNAMLARIRECDEELKSSYLLRDDAASLVVRSQEALALAQEAFDRAVCEARGVEYIGPAREQPEAPAETDPVPAPARGQTFAPMLPPPMPVARHFDTGQGAALPYHLATPDDREEGVGE